MSPVCPFLGVPGDSEVHYGYPNALNVCYASHNGWSVFQPLEVARQQVCLSGDYLMCPAYLRPAREKAQKRRKQVAQTHLQFFGLREEPFSIVPQPRFACESESQRQAHAWLRWVIEQRHGLGVVYGAVGTGKTLLCHSLREELTTEQGMVCTLLLTPAYRSEYAMMADLLGHWQAMPKERRSLHHLETAAHQFLVEAVLEQQRTVVLIVDEAQTLSRSLLQQVCKLLNWQDGSKQLLQVILAGQPVLQDRLASVPALRDRAVVEYQLLPMDDQDVARMIVERLRRAGRQGDLFTPSAMQLVYRQTNGMPRRATILCLLCLWVAYEEGQHQIGTDTVRAALERAGRVSEIVDAGEWAGKAADELVPSNGSARQAAWLPGIMDRVRGLFGREARQATEDKQAREVIGEL